MAALKIQQGYTVKNKDGKTGTVKSLMPVKTGGRGRPKTVAVVEHPDGIAEYGVSDLKIVAQLS